MATTIKRPVATTAAAKSLARRLVDANVSVVGPAPVPGNPNAGHAPPAPGAAPNLPAVLAPNPQPAAVPMAPPNLGIAPPIAKPVNGQWDTNLPAADRAKLDPQVRLVISLIKVKDFQQLYARLGIAPTAAGPGNRSIPLLVQLAIKGKPTVAALGIWIQFFATFNIPLGYLVEILRFKKLRQVTARIPLDPEIYAGKAQKLEEKLSELLANATRVSLAVPIPPSGDASLRDMALPIDRRYNGHDLTGKGAIVGIIDDGCALANWNFLKPHQHNTRVQSRILYLWDPARTTGGSGWVPPAFTGFPIPKRFKLGPFPGYELPRDAIEDAIEVGRNVDIIDEDAVYDYLDYSIVDTASHGTHVMDIAAGNGRALRSTEGVAPEADIIFVQLPRVAVESGGAALMESILDGAAYIFAKATDLGRPAVVNISYGANLGSHDGTSQIESGLDDLLSVSDRAVVIAAGNGFETDCHARETIRGRRPHLLRWVVRPEDPTSNDLEIWYDAAATLEVTARSPDGTIVAGPVQLGKSIPITLPNGDIIGSITHAVDAGNGDKRILVTLRPTTADSRYGNNAPAPSGLWQIRLRKFGNAPARMHAWIERDDRGRTRDARRRQSSFHPDDAHPSSTVVGLANGFHTVTVGGYNTATQEIVRYSACGPTRPHGRRPIRKKPDVLAPAAEDAGGRGVLSASSLSANPSRMNGTSASAPQVAGLVALMFQYHADVGRPNPLDADTIIDLLKRGANPAPLRPSRHQQADDTRPIKQSDVLKDVVGAGKVNVVETLKLI